MLKEKYLKQNNNIISAVKNKVQGDILVYNKPRITDKPRITALKKIETEFGLATMSIALKLAENSIDDTYNFVIDKIKPSLQKARKLTKEANHGFISTLKKTQEEYNDFENYITASSKFIQQGIKLIMAVNPVQRNEFLLYLGKLVGWRNDVADGENKRRNTEFLWITFGDYKYTEVTVQDGSEINCIHTDVPDDSDECLVRLNYEDSTRLMYYNEKENVFYEGHLKHTPIDYLTTYIQLKYIN